MPADKVVTTPPVPATTVAIANPYAVPVLIQLFKNGATITSITINGHTQAIVDDGQEIFVLKEGSTIALTYTVAVPIWEWYSLT